MDEVIVAQTEVNSTRAQRSVRKFLGLISKLNQKWAVDIGLQIFSTPMSRRKRNHYLPDGVRKRKVTIQGKKINIYHYGKSSKKAFLAHGWEGAASDFSQFFKPLVKQGFEVVAIDFPGHGESGFSQLNALIASDLLVQIHKEEGPFSVLIGHSFGAFSLGLASSKEPALSKLPFISLGSPTRLSRILSEYSKFVAFDSFQSDYVNSKVENDFNIRISDIDQGKFMKHHEGPVMVVHDKQDKMVPIDRLEDIKKETSSPLFYITDGLGHTKILWNRKVVEQVVSFAAEESII